jgi:LuxR family transcriptional regulator, maltose regulon positive regulatory protein
MDEAARVTPGREVAGLLNHVPALRARLLLAQGDLRAAVRWVGQRGLRPDDQPSYPREPGYLLLARVLLAQQRPEQALGLLDRLHAVAVAQGRTGSLIEVLALRSLALAAGGEEPGAVAALGVPLGYLGRLVRAFERDAAPVIPGLVEQLSPRELEVLRLLAAGRANQQIAEELVVPPNTVKKHVTHILEKLGAANRTEATARARELGLLD